MNKKDNIITILTLQDVVTKKYLTDNPSITERYQFCIDCLNWSYDFSNRQGKKYDLIISYLFADCFSSILVSTNIALWGTIIDALNVLRPALEILSIADYVIDKKKFNLLREELKKKDFDQLKFKKLMKRGFIDKKLEKEWLAISNMASHGTPLRLKKNLFKMDGKTFSRFGVAYEPRDVKLVFGNIARVSLYLTVVQSQILDKKDVLIPQQKELEKNYEKLKK